MTLRRFSISLVLLATLAGTARAQAQPPREELLRYATDTWRSFEALTLPSGLPADALVRGDDGKHTPNGLTSTTDIAAYLWSILAAESLHILGRDEAHRRLDQSLTALGGLERSHGFFLNWYDPRDGSTLREWPGGGKVRPSLSSVDNGWLAASLMMIGRAHPELRPRADALLAPMNFGFFYNAYDAADPVAHPGQLYISYQVDEKAYAPYLYGLLNTEPRIVSYIGIAQGDLPAEHYHRIHRTFRPDRKAQGQVPDGEVREQQGVPVYQGHYTYRDFRFVPSWGGSMFEAMMVPLFIPESRWSPESWGVNHNVYVRAQMEYGLREANHGFWGYSPSLSPAGGYREYGVPPLASMPGGYPSGDLDTPTTPVHGIVTPHASFLALSIAPNDALANLAALRAKFPEVYGPYGFFDAVSVRTGQVARGVLSLDQGMILAAIANHLNDDVMQHYLSDGLVEAQVKPLLAAERFTASAPAAVAVLPTTPSVPSRTTPTAVATGGN